MFLTTRFPLSVLFHLRPFSFNLKNFLVFLLRLLIDGKMENPSQTKWHKPIYINSVRRTELM